MGSIMENRFNILITIIVFLAILYTVRGLLIVNQDSVDFDVNSDLIAQKENIDIYETLGDLGKSVFLQIDDAPDIINAFMGLISGILIFTIALIIATYIREFIGLT